MNLVKTFSVGSYLRSSHRWQCRSLTRPDSSTQSLCQGWCLRIYTWSYHKHTSFHTCSSYSFGSRRYLWFSYAYLDTLNSNGRNLDNLLYALLCNGYFLPHCLVPQVQSGWVPIQLSSSFSRVIFFNQHVVISLLKVHIAQPGSLKQLCEQSSLESVRVDGAASCPLQIYSPSFSMQSAHGSSLSSGSSFSFFSSQFGSNMGSHSLLTVLSEQSSNMGSHSSL